jgi:hypothetical protein
MPRQDLPRTLVSFPSQTVNSALQEHELSKEEDDEHHMEKDG